MPRILRSLAFDVFGFRLFPMFWAMVFLSVPIFSAVPPNLLVIRGPLASLTLIAYGLLLATLAIFPYRYPKLHAHGAALAVLVLAGRAGGFLELALQRGEWSLTAAILERLGFAAALFFWHRASMTRIGIKRLAVPAP